MVKPPLDLVDRDAKDGSFQDRTESAGSVAAPPSTRRRVLLRLVKLCVLLALCDWFVTGVFFERWIEPRYVLRFDVLRDRIAGQNLRPLFDSLARIPSRDTIVAFVGDSTMNDAEASEHEYIPYLIRQKLKWRFGLHPVTTVDASELGMYASDAALFITKLFNNGTDIVVYGVTPRAFPRKPLESWVSHVSEQLGVADLASLLSAGAGSWMWSQFTAEQIVGGVVWSNWALYAYRTQLRAYLWETVFRQMISDKNPLSTLLKPQPLRARPPIAPRRAQLVWRDEEYGPPSMNWEALEIINRICAQKGPNRCVFYASPLNPAVRDSVTTASFYKDYVDRLRGTVERHGQRFVDLSDSLSPAEFHPPRFGGPDPLHPNLQGRTTLTDLLTDPVSAAITGLLQQEATASP